MTPTKPATSNYHIYLFHDNLSIQPLMLSSAYLILTARTAIYFSNVRGIWILLTRLKQIDLEVVLAMPFTLSTLPVWLP